MNVNTVGVEYFYGCKTTEENVGNPDVTFNLQTIYKHIPKRWLFPPI